MALTKEFLDAVEQRDVTMVRIMLKDSMLVDPSLKTFEEMLQAAGAQLPGLYDAHDGEELKQNPSEWDEDYMNLQMVSVVSNFSRERVALLKKIVKKLFGTQAAQQPQTRSTAAAPTDTPVKVTPKASEAPAEGSGGPSGIQIAGGIVGVAGAGALIGGIIGSSVPVAVIGGAALAGGVAMILLGRKKED